MHSSVSILLASSQVSTPSWIVLSPQIALRQVLRHASPSTWLPSSHSSPTWTLASPHDGSAQVLVDCACRL